MISQIGSSEAPAITMPPVEIPVDDEIMLRRYDLVSPVAKHLLLQDNRAFWGQWLPWAFTDGVQDTAVGHKQTVEQVALGLQAPYGVIIKDQLAGAAILHSREDNTAELGCYLGAQWLGRGVMNRAARTVADYGFSEWGLDEIKLFIKPTNERSIATARKLGAKSLGQQRRDSEGWIHTYTAWKIGKHD